MYGRTAVSSLIGVVLAVCNGSAVAETTSVDRYTVNAQYRDAVKKAFRGVGSGSLAYLEQQQACPGEGPSEGVARRRRDQLHHAIAGHLRLMGCFGRKLQ